MAALTELGLADRIQSAGSVLREVEVRDGHGRLLRRTRMPEVRPPDLPGLIALRPVIHGALLDAVASDASCLEVAAIATGFRDSADGVELRLAGGRAERGDVLIGADGVGSTIRQHLHPHEAPARPSG